MTLAGGDMGGWREGWQGGRMEVGWEGTPQNRSALSPTSSSFRSRKAEQRGGDRECQRNKYSPWWHTQWDLFGIVVYWIPLVPVYIFWWLAKHFWWAHSLFYWILAETVIQTDDMYVCLSTDTSAQLLRNQVILDSRATVCKLFSYGKHTELSLIIWV